ncbi:MAG TPA: MarR family transcriptional regulator [Bacteroidetes bacterium]|nr:MarR family transcriptional regulator [Bacteroidota bacterium]
MKIEEEIRQNSFPNEYLKANINLLFTHAWLFPKYVRDLKAFNLSSQQFNVLRILRGRHPQPASIRELTERMLDKSSNASRLVDKLLAKGWVSKTACKSDSRKVQVHITEEGLEVLANASAKLEKKIQHVFSALTEEEAAQLSALLDKLRS